MESNQVIGALAGLAQESRLNIFRELVKAASPSGEGGLTPTALSERLDIPAPTLSFHLKELSRANLVSSTRYGRSLIYQANISSIQALIGFLMEDCCSTTPSPHRSE